jgi:ankyrin repeat protein
MTPLTSAPMAQMTTRSSGPRVRYSDGALPERRCCWSFLPCRLTVVRRCRGLQRIWPKADRVRLSTARRNYRGEAGDGKGKVSIIRRLIEAGAEVHAVDGSRATPLHWAARSSSVDAVAVLLCAGARVNARDHQGATPLHHAAATEWRPMAHSRAEVAQLLLDHGAELAAVDRSGQTPLHRAASSGNTLLIRRLLQQGGNACAADEAGKTPRDLAKDGGFSMAVRLLAPADRPGPA